MRSQSGSLRQLTLEQICTSLEFSPIPTAILQWDKVLYLSPAARELLGVETADEIFHNFILKWAEPGTSEETRRKRIARLKEKREEIWISKKRWVRRSGKWARMEGGPLVVEVMAWSLPLAGGGGTQITFSDVTARVQAREKGQQSSEQLRLAIESAEIGIWDLSPAEKKLRCSTRCQEIFGASLHGELDYPAFLKLIHPEDRTRVEASIQKSFDGLGSGEFGCDYRVLFADGKVRWIALKGHAYFETKAGQREATRLIGTALDITELRQTDAFLRQSEKLAATGRLAASIAHEINNPLESIINLLYLLQDGPLDPDQRKYADMAQHELARVVDISTQALRFYADPSAPTPCDIAEIIDSALTLFGGRITALHIRIDRRYRAKATVLGGREELRQVMGNLIHNAVDAMSHGGRLAVRTRETTRPGGRKGLRITVADTGHGMSPATRKRMFEPFFTTRETIGTGLGLWLCAGIVQKHGGDIHVKSRQKPGSSGTVISVFLPLDRRR